MEKYFRNTLDVSTESKEVKFFELAGMPVKKYRCSFKRAAKNSVSHFLKVPAKTKGSWNL